MSRRGVKSYTTHHMMKSSWHLVIPVKSKHLFLIDKRHWPTVEVQCDMTTVTMMTMNNSNNRNKSSKMKKSKSIIIILTTTTTIMKVEMMVMAIVVVIVITLTIIIQKIIIKIRTKLAKAMQTITEMMNSELKGMQARSRRRCNKQTKVQCKVLLFFQNGNTILPSMPRPTPLYPPKFVICSSSFKSTSQRQHSFRQNCYRLFQTTSRQ